MNGTLPNNHSHRTHKFFLAMARRELLLRRATSRSRRRWLGLSVFTAGAPHVGQELLFKRTKPLPHRDHHGIHWLAVALGAGVLCRRGAQEAWAPRRSTAAVSIGSLVRSVDSNTSGSRRSNGSRRVMGLGNSQGRDRRRQRLTSPGTPVGCRHAMPAA